MNEYTVRLYPGDRITVIGMAAVPAPVFPQPMWSPSHSDDGEQLRPLANDRPYRDPEATKAAAVDITNAAAVEQFGTPDFEDHVRQALDIVGKDDSDDVRAQAEKHSLAPDHNGEPTCKCGWDPLRAAFGPAPRTRGEAIQLVRGHLFEVGAIRYHVARCPYVDSSGRRCLWDADHPDSQPHAFAGQVERI